MKIFEKLLYSSIIFLFVYVVVSIGLRIFEATSVYNSHLIGGVLATLLGIVTFMYLLVKKNNR